MSEVQGDSVSRGSAGGSLRPALIASRRVLSEYSRFLEHFLVGLADESVLSALVCPWDFEAESIVSPAVEIFRYPAYRLAVPWYRNRRRLLEQLELFKPTVLHCLCRSRAVLTMQLARRLNLPYVLSVNSLQKRFSRFYVSARRCSAVIAAGRTIAADITRCQPGLAGRVEQINMGTFVDEGSICFRRSGQVASMVTTHRVDDAGDFVCLLGAVKHLAIDGYEFMLVITGGGRAEARLRKLLAEKGLCQIVVVVPRFEPCCRVLAAGDIFIQPQPSKAFNPLLLEAMSVGAAVAACKGGVDDLIIEGKTAVVFEADDELSIYESLRQLFDSRQWARQLARAAQEHLKENYTVSEMISSVFGVYRRAQEEFEKSKVKSKKAKVAGE